MLKYALLGSLNYYPMTGYELKQFMDTSTAYFWHARLSQIYTTLKDLEASGLVRSTIEPQEDRPDRRVYTLTEAGRQDLQAWLSQPYTALSQPKETLLLKLFFSARVDRESLLTQLRLQRSLHQQQVDTYQADTAGLIAEAVAHNPALEKDALLWEATLRFGEAYEALYVQWLDDTIRLVEERF